MFITRVWILLLCYSLVFFPTNSASTELLSDLMLFLKKQVKLALFVCWDEDKSFKFLRKMLQAPQVHFVQLKSVAVENIAILDTPEPHQHLAVIDISCPGSGKFLAEAQYRIYNKIRWVLWNENGYEKKTNGGDEQEDVIFRSVAGLPVTGLSEVYYFSVERGETVIKDVYRRSVMMDLDSSVVGVWRNGTIEDKRWTQSVVMRRRNLQKLPIKTSLVYTINYTLSHFGDFENTGVDSIPRTSYLLLDTLFTYYLNATMEKRFVTTWGYPDHTTGIWNGMSGELIYHHSEAAGTMLRITQNRLLKMEYAKMPIPLRIKFIFKAPNLSETSNIFQMPFDFSVWMCTLALVAITATVFAVVHGVLMLRRKNSIRNRYIEMLNAAYDIIPVATQQGSLLKPKSLAQKIMIFVSLAGLMFIEVSFSAKIISLIQAPSKKINSIRNLVESRLELGTDGQPYNFYFSKASDPVGIELYKRITNRNADTLNAYDTEQGVRKLQTELFAYHGFTSTLYQQISRTFNDVEKCYLRELTFFDSIGYFSVQLNFTLREHFHIGLMKMLEAGVATRLVSRMLNEKPGCTKGVMFRPLDLVDTRFAMEIAAFGILEAVCLLLAEIVLSKYTLLKHLCRTMWNRLP
ncbi:uncharacterized protein LOC129728300 [Wyeomyia smithii]|uniref:uncharacterized protein LOC129728300 n=1 Tax=Wyeomyia smithii TaxID=174621 RepID=UPI002467F8A3|nr:uncharacterized protein LOC129728300 [Wyeomyia smithii]